MVEIITRRSSEGFDREPRREMEPIKAKIALICPGQGGQYQGMGLELWEHSEAARRTFQQADDILGIPISEYCFRGSKEDLAKTSITQMAMATTIVANNEALKELYPSYAQAKPVVVGGVSFGEFTMLVLSGVVDFPTFLQLAKERGRLMEEAGKENKGAMSTVLGLDREIVNQICEERGIYPAIYYGKGITVVSGLSDNLKKAEADFLKLDARVRPTGVENPFHTNLMHRAGKELEIIIKDLPLNDPICPFVINPAGKALTTAEEIRKWLPRQLITPVDVDLGFDIMEEYEPDVYCEPFKPVLTPFVRKRGHRVANPHDRKSIETARQEFQLLVV